MKRKQRARCGDLQGHSAAVDEEMIQPGQKQFFQTLTSNKLLQTKSFSGTNRRKTKSKPKPKQTNSRNAPKPSDSWPLSPPSAGTLYHPSDSCSCRIRWRVCQHQRSPVWSSERWKEVKKTYQPSTRGVMSWWVFNVCTLKKWNN